MLEIGEVQVTYLKNGSARYLIEMAHRGLKKHRVIKGEHRDIVRQKARLEAEKWQATWEKQQARQAARQHKEDATEEAADRTTEAQELLHALEGVLHATLSVDDTVNWSDLEDHSDFPESPPIEPGRPGGPQLHPEPPAPDPSSKAYTPQIGLLDKLLKTRGEEKRNAAARALQNARQTWQQDCERVERQNQALMAEHAEALAHWQSRKETFESDQAAANQAVRLAREAYFRGEPDAVEEYCDLVLSKSSYPDVISLEHELQYLPDTKTLVVETQLPDIDDLPTLTEVRYVQSRDEFVEKFLSDSHAKRQYDSVLYQSCLRTLHELFEADAVEAIDAIALNGNVTSVDRATGKSVTACVLSIQVSKPEFMEVNLEAVDPKACFKNFKGVGSSKLHSLTPVAPVMQFRREDGRFVSAREVANTLHEAVNLAAMDWEDFEHLIREVFEQEFKTGGGEVSVTQASRDGGVDAIAYDPDPIRGGKIVIQAKRYTNTVGVAAVRDLYGTVLNEGATKGILVTTSDYGPDAYGFAKDKPITLLSGANLLHMLSKHGHRAKIDIKEAKRLFTEGP